MNWKLLRNRRVTPPRQPAGKPAGPHPSIEALEPRIAPATLVGLTTKNSLVLFDSGNPALIFSSVKITGLAPGEDIVSIDARPANGLLYGLTKQNTLYTLNPYSGVATAVTPAGLVAPALTGKTFAMDFNPSVDRLRVVSDAEQNLRINPNTGIAVDGDAGTAGTQPDTALAFNVGDPNEGKNPNLTAVAYDRNFQGATQTTLYAIDSTLNALVRIGGVDGTPSPNGGTVFTMGSLGVDPSATIGFDISDNGVAFATMLVKGKTKLYTINLTTGAATEVAAVGKGTTKLDAVTTLPRDEIVYGVTQSNRLVSFHANDPGRLESVVGLRGLIVGERVTSIDFRPASGELFGLTTLNRVVSIDRATGQTTQLGVPLVTSPQFAVGGAVGLDFNPTVDRLRLVNAANDNLRFNPLTWLPVDSDANAANGNTPDTDLAFDATDANVGQDPNIAGVAYDRNDNDGATATTLFGIDSTLNILVSIGGANGTPSPNGGLIFTLGALGVDVTDEVGFDIIDAGFGGNGAALAVMQVQGESVSKLFSINVTGSFTNQPLGSATLIGTVAGGEVITAMAIAPPVIQFAAPQTIVKEKGGTVAVIELTRTGGHGSAASVNFSTFDGTALAGLDYTAVTNLLVTFAPGETHKRVEIPILSDKVKENDEHILLSLSSATGGNTMLGNLLTALATIRKN